MASNSDYFLKKSLGDDFFESLSKFELWKPGTKTTVDHEEIKTALQIVPRVLMSVLIRELSSMNLGETKEIVLPVDISPATIRATKHERDVYSGEIEQDNKKVVDFKYRSIPGVGLVVMSAFELYDTSKLVQEDKAEAKSEDLESKIQRLVNERLALHDLVNKVVEKKLEQKDAIHQLFLARLGEEVKKANDISSVAKIASEEPEAKKDEYFRGMANGLQVADSIANNKEPKFIDAPKSKKQSPLKNFLENKKNKSKPKAIEFSIEMSKGEHVDCPDCGKNIFDGQVFSGCICLGDDMDKKVYVKKTEEGVKMRFGRGWDADNIEMLLEVLRSKRG